MPTKILSGGCIVLLLEWRGHGEGCVTSGILHKNLGIPKIGVKKSAHQARFPSPINRLLNLVFSDYCQIWIIRTHWNSSKLPNLVIQVT
jgi:hypothetical protein